ncbi:MAG: hypothetical protein OXF50_13455 [Caldilineaceae bacterium]|nr:hypothetical protein [Caldilineaceae bacterium]
MELVVLIAGLIIVYVIGVNVVIRFMRALLRFPQREQRGSEWRSHEDFLFRKPLDRYERRERKGRIREWR